MNLRRGISYVATTEPSRLSAFFEIENFKIKSDSLIGQSLSWLATTNTVLRIFPGWEMPEPLQISGEQHRGMGRPSSARTVKHATLYQCMLS